MPTTPKLPLKLHEKLGDEAMTELLNLFGDLGAETRAEFQNLHQEFAQVKQQIADVKQQVADFKHDVTERFGRTDARIAGVLSELTRWTFLFGLGTIGIVLLLLSFTH